jgi:pimeloyl-ACP methyl ester carboxylesterase
MQYAIHRLGFKPEQIVVMGWSIGGYAATWLAMNYPDIKGLVRSCYTVFYFNRSFLYCFVFFLFFLILYFILQTV